MAAKANLGLASPFHPDRHARLVAFGALALFVGRMGGEFDFRRAGNVGAGCRQRNHRTSVFIKGGHGTVGCTRLRHSIKEHAQESVMLFRAASGKHAHKHQCADKGSAKDNSAGSSGLDRWLVQGNGGVKRVYFFFRKP